MKEIYLDTLYISKREVRRWESYMINAKSLCLTYGDGTKALSDVNLKIKPGELIFITGVSGSGKTSLLKLLMGMEFPSTGTLEVLNQPIVMNSDRKIRKLRRNFGPIFQEFKLIKGRTALENVMMGMGFLSISPKKRKEYGLSALERVGLSHKALSMVDNLSWGEAQRVAIARAVARKPAIILADEPTGNLDHNNAVHILDLLTSFVDKNTSVIITTHATHLINIYQQATFLKVEKGHISISKKTLELESEMR